MSSNRVHYLMIYGIFVSDSGNTMEDGLRLILWILVGITAPGNF